MRTQKLTATLAVLLLATTALGSGVALAADTNVSTAKTPPTAQAGADQTAQAKLSGQQGAIPFRVSDKAATALDGITVARLALMQNSGNDAKKVLDQVKTLLSSADGGIAKATLASDEDKSGKNAKLTDSTYFPVGFQSMVNEEISYPAATDAGPTGKSGTVAKDEMSDQVAANAELDKDLSQQKTAQADIAKPKDTVDEAVMVALLPKDSTMKALDEAMGHIDKGNLEAADSTLALIGQSILYGTMSQEKSMG